MKVIYLNTKQKSIKTRLEDRIKTLTLICILSVFFNLMAIVKIVYLD